MKNVDLPELDYSYLFQFLPERFLIFRTDDPDFTLYDTNRIHSTMAMIEHDEVVGKPFFEVFPDVSPKFKKTGVSDLRESFRRVIRTGKPDTMDTFRYDIRQPDGSFVQRYWRPTHYPLKDTKGKLSFIIQVSHDVTDEVYTERRLKAAESQLNEALEIGRVGTWIWDVVHNRIVADAMLSRLFGVDPAEGAAGLPLKTFTDAIHPEDRERVTKLIEKTVGGNGNFEAEYRTITADGATRWVLARGRIETDDNGKPMNFPGVLVDITQRKEVEQKFNQQLAFTNTITSSLGEGVYALDANGKLTYMNKAAETMLGWTEKELLGQSLHDIVHANRPDGSVTSAEDCHLLSVFHTGKIVRDDDDMFTRKDGTKFMANSTAAPILQNGKIVGIVQSFSDISERKQAAHNQALLSQASKVLSSSLDYTKTISKVAKLIVPHVADWSSIELYDEEHGLQQIGLAHKDPAKVVWAQKLRETYPTDMASPNGVPHVIRTGASEFYPAITDEMLVAGARSEEHLHILRTLNFTSVIVVPITAGKQTVGAITLATAEQKRRYSKADLAMAQELGNRIGMTIANADLYHTATKELAERKRLEAELLEANERLEARVAKRTAQLERTNESLQRSNRELQDFAYVASHDLQEPLRKIQAFGNLLQSEYAGVLGEGSDYLDRMRNAASRMSILIEDLLSFSRVTTRARPFTELNLQQIAHEVVGDLETRINDTRGTVHIGDLPTIMGDAVQMRQLLQNLIANALKFHKPDVPPVVRVDSKTIKSKGGKIQAHQLTIADNGIGFDEKYLDRIFAVFQRLHGHEAYEGTGIGLAVCRKIIERHGGEITATSIPGEGSTFIITLPTKLSERGEAA